MPQILKALCLLLAVSFLASCNVGTDKGKDQSAPSDSGENLPGQQEKPSPALVPRPPEPQIESTPKGWYDDYNAAMAAARQTNRPVFVLFTGSDWCGWCIKLRNDVLTRPDFKKLAAEELILMFVDSPDGFALPPRVKQAHEMLAQTLGAGGGVPHAILVSPDGKKLGDISGYRKETEYLDELRKIIRRK
ncbi:MAG: thioredoxin family protein [Victivallales bacterium]|nr:thioredoxin family protein [Victivallales bacterium]